MNRSDVLKRRLSLCALVLVGQMAQGADEDAGRRYVDNFVADVITFQGNFEQALLDADGQVIDKTTGTLEIQRPGQFRWSYIEPYEQWLVADGLNVWSYDVDLAQVTVKPQASALANTPALLLGGSSDALEQFTYEESYVEADTTWVRLTPKNTQSGFERVELGFRDGTLHRMVFFDNLEQTTLVALTEVAVNLPIDADRFNFVVPEDVDVVGVPAVADILEP
jgi:outer membrane lipoprotein carrier protein